MRVEGKSLPASTLTPLHKTQNDCLRRVCGAYKRTPRAVVEREANIMPIDLQLEIGRYRQTVRTKTHPVESQIAHAADTI